MNPDELKKKVLEAVEEYFAETKRGDYPLPTTVEECLAEIAEYNAFTK